jgi:hypothetical protein
MPDEPPVPVGSPRPFQSQGEWWHEKPDGSLHRWSAFNDSWVERPFADKGQMLAKDDAFRKRRRRQDWTLPIAMVAILTPLVLLTIAAMRSKGASAPQAFAIAGVWMALATGLFYLLWRRS